jgi:hypothetical protein
MKLAALANMKFVKPKRRSRVLLKRAIKSAIQQDKFFQENSCVDVSDGFEGSIHIVVISDKFNEMSERVRQGHVSKALETAGLATDEEDLITLVFAASPKELK